MATKWRECFCSPSFRLLMDDFPNRDQGLDSLAKIYTQKLSSRVLCMQSGFPVGFNRQRLTSRDEKYSSVTPKVDTDLSLVGITAPESGIKDVKFIINCIHLVKIHNLTLHPQNVRLFLTGSAHLTKLQVSSMIFCLG